MSLGSCPNNNPWMVWLSQLPNNPEYIYLKSHVRWTKQIKYLTTSLGGKHTRQSEMVEQKTASCQNPKDAYISFITGIINGATIHRMIATAVLLHSVMVWFFTHTHTHTHTHTLIGNYKEKISMDTHKWFRWVPSSHKMNNHTTCKLLIFSIKGKLWVFQPALARCNECLEMLILSEEIA